MGFFRQLLSNFNDPIIKILIGALLINALVSMGRMNIPETLGIVAAILIATLVSTISEYGSSLAFDRLSGREGDTLCMIRRAGEIREVRISDIAVGDIVLLRAGMSIPADGVLISGGVSCNQAAITEKVSNGVKSLPREHPLIRQEKIGSPVPPINCFAAAVSAAVKGKWPFCGWGIPPSSVR